MQTMEIETTHWKEEEFQLRNELHEAKLNSNQNLDGLREELRLSEVIYFISNFLFFFYSFFFFEIYINNNYNNRQQLKN